jgi:hypothetical protein
MTYTPRTAARMALALALTGVGALPASTQTLVGNWAPINHEDAAERGAGPALVDYSGIPLTEAGRQRGLTWDAAILTMPEHQCKPHPSTYGYRGIGGPRIDRIVDPKNFSVVALTMHIPWMEQRRTVWLDGRPHPPEHAAHTWQGFSTGRWEGETLVVDTTHLKAGWVRRNGLALSDKATMREYFIRHGNTLTHTYVISDPYYLSEPLIKTSGFQLANNDNLAPYPCQAVEEVDRPSGVVPSYLPGKNPYQDEFAKRYNLPLKGVLGGAETALPEFVRGMDTSASMAVKP